MSKAKGNIACALDHGGELRVRTDMSKYAIAKRMAEIYGCSISTLYRKL